MNESSSKMGRYAVGGAVALCLVILLGWFAFHEERPPLDQPSVKVEPAKPHARHVAPAFEPADDLSSEKPASQPNDSVATNAALIYRQAFALFDGLTNDQKNLLRDWQTNVDTSVEAELCEKLRPICELMHQASAVTNCDWGIGPITVETVDKSILSHLGPSRAIARAAIWSAAHCRSNDVAGATDDAVSVLRLGQQVSRTAVIGCLVDMAVQGLTSSYVVQNVRSFSGADGQRLVAVFADPSYGEAPSRAMEAEAYMVDRSAAKLAAMSEAELKNNWPEDNTNPAKMDRATVLTEYQQIADSDRELAKASASSSEDEYEAWVKHSTELQASNPLGALLSAYDRFVEKARAAEVNRAMVVAGLAVAENGTEALAAHLDPASGKPFVYTETDDGFELQSTIVVNDKPYKIRFK